MTTLRRLSRRSAALPAVLLAVGLLALPAAAGPSLEEIQARKARAAQRAAELGARGDTLAGKVSALDAMRAAAEATVTALEDQLDRLDQRIKDKQKQLTEAQKRMAVLTAELQDVLADLGIRTDAFVDRAVAAYKAGPTAYVEGVLSSGSFNDLIDRYEYYQAALDADSALLDEIETLRDGVEMRRTEVEQRQEEIAEAKLTMLKDRAAIEVIHEERSIVLAEREQIVQAKQVLLSDVRGKQRHYEAIVAQLEQDAAEVRALLASQGSSSGQFPTGGGQLLWPAAGPLTSPYGYRTHPIFGDTRLHTGIDIGASYGAPVIASDAGTVVFAGVMSGYGNAVVVDHGNGLATTYNHLSAFFVAGGQGVARGSQVGAVGCSGYCTGPHLHFEVRVNGNPVDPMPYLQ
jgi:murein DD-endopeptidase MepM/ murein hydrolase activator NlpD